MAKNIRHFLDLDEIAANDLRAILDAGHAMKKAGKRTPKSLCPPDIEDDVLVMIFEKPSTRTRVSFDVAMRQLGGQSIMLNNTDLQLGRGESIADTARVLSRYIDAIMIRADSHQTLLDLAKWASVPVINGLTDATHPCQIMADLMTFEEHLGPIKGKTIAWVGDGNNVAASWIHAAERFDCTLRLACPEALMPEQKFVDWAKDHKADVQISTDPAVAVKDAHCIITDTWVSMGQKDAEHRKKTLEPYRVDDALMAKADPKAIFMHCLPAYRGHEVTESVLEGPQSVIFDEAENRLHAEKAVLAWCLGASF